VAILLAVAIGASVVSWAQSRSAESGWRAGAPCSVALEGHDMNATVRGETAVSVCRAWLGRRDSLEKGGTAAFASDDPVQCDERRDGLEITVRDSGDHDYGSALCTGLQCWAESQSAPLPPLDARLWDSLESPCRSEP
jgi:hypothetical protein